MKSFSELTSASQVNNGDLLAISQTSGSGYASKKTTVKDITDKSNLNLAEEYDSTSTYAVDDYVIYESVLYKCIGTTTGTFDSTKWTQVVVTDEMGSGGGGGTGGHTIIDENGNSMTARAGLQFVGGANVSDDSTNNRTIVDLASAGGIDGVFIDTENIVKNDFTLDGNAHDWVATEDCILQGKFMPISSSADAYINADNISLFVTYQTNQITAFLIPIKKGQTISYKSLSGNNTYTASMIAYGIQTGTTHSKFQPVIYSTEEREVGVWIDGKPLYEKTISCGVLPSDTTIKDVAHNISNIDNVVYIFGTAKRQDGTTFTTMIDHDVTTSSPYYANNVLRTWVNDTNVRIKAGNDRSNYTSSFVTIRYTKTTDVAGSGSWTPQGVPTHHYSTDEHIVGTWIDGKTLYEKTIDFGSDTTVPQSSWSWLASITNVETIVLCFGNYSTGTYYPLMAYHDGDKINVMACRDGASASVRYLTLQYTKTS